MTLSPVVFVIEIDQRPIAAFAARSVREAIELSRETWFREELKHLTSHGQPLWDAKAPIKARSARAEEIRAYQDAPPPTADEEDEIQLVYLVDIDRKRRAPAPVNRGAFPPR